MAQKREHANLSTDLDDPSAVDLVRERVAQVFPECLSRLALPGRELGTGPH
jgi:hypothetical protein